MRALVIWVVAAGWVCVQAQTRARQKADGPVQGQEGYFYISWLHDIGEPPLVQSDDAGKAHAYRLVLMAFPWAVTRVWRLQIHGDGTGTFFAKKTRLNQAELLFSKEQTVAAGTVDEFLTCVKRADFWEMATKEDHEPNVVDGSYWFFEGIRDGRYHLVTRKSPEGRLEAFADIGRCLGKDVGQLDEADVGIPDSNTWYNPGRIVSNFIGVRDQLKEQQARDGLTIANYNNGLEIFDFKKGKAFRGPKLSPYPGGGGAVTPDGTRVEVQLLSSGPAMGIMRADNSEMREFPGMEGGSQVCWCRNGRSIAMVVAGKEGPRLELLDVETKSRKDIAAADRVTSQCWSRSGKEIVFENDGDVVVANVEDGKQRTIAAGQAPTWFPGTDQVAFFDPDKHSYYIVQSSGAGKKKLFHSRRGMAGLYWSPDGRVVAYVVEVGGFVSLEGYQLRIRRLFDGAETSFNGDFGCCETWQWVTNKDLIAWVEQWGTTR